jgi:hypothetical protein
MPLENLLWRQQFLAIARPVRGDLRRRCAIKALFPLVILDLLTAEAGGFEILLRITLDLRLAVLAALQLVAQPLQPCRQL